MNTFSTLFFLPLAHFTFCAWKGEACAVCCRCQNYSIDWEGLPFTDFTFHVIDCFSISSLQCDCGLLRRLTLIWVIFRLSQVSQNPQNNRSTDLPIHESTKSRVHESTNPRSTNPQIHESTNPRVHYTTNPRIHESIVLFGCASHSTLYAADRILYTVPEKTEKRLALCTALPVLGVLWYGSLLHSVDR